MVQAPDFRLNNPSYNAVKINITNPKVNAGSNGVEVNSPQNGERNYNGVLINIDNPEVNATGFKSIYDYPKSQEIVTYDKTNVNPQVTLPQGFGITYHTTNVILPKTEIKPEFDLDIEIEDEEAEEVEENEVEESEETETAAAEEDAVDVPEPNFTTVEAEKNSSIEDDVKIMEAETKEIELKKPEIIPEEPIMPDVDVASVVSNLTNSDYDVQAIQMEEIARKTLENPENGIPYVVREVFTGLIDIANKDTSNLTPPSKEQIVARQKIIENYFMGEQDSNKVNKLTEKDIALANKISPLEQAERNKEYALYTIALLSKVYVNEVEKHTGNVVPMTDLPGTSAMTDSLRYAVNPAVKAAAIDALVYISRPEYKEELTSILTIAQSDSNKDVADYATRAVNRVNQ